VTQATFVTFIEVSRRFEGRSKVRTFLFGILYRKIAEARRAGRKQERVDAIDETIESRFRLDGRWQRPPRPVDLQLYDDEIRDAIESVSKTPPRRSGSRSSCATSKAYRPRKSVRFSTSAAPTWE